MSEAIIKNLDFFIGLRNKIEHRYLAQSEIDKMLFGECQSLLYNYENFLIDIFGENYSINENLAFSLQFSTYRTPQQAIANKNVLSREIFNIKDYIEKYRNNLPQDIYDSQEYSIKLIQIPKISNTNRSDLAIEFIKLNELNDIDKEKFNKLNAIIKDKIVKVEVSNAGGLKAGGVINKVAENLEIKFTHHLHRCLYFIFSIRPTFLDKNISPFDTNIKYCHYDEPHKDYIYSESWTNFIINLFKNSKLSIDNIKILFKNKTKLDIKDYI